MNQTRLRATWNGTPVELQTLWTVSKGSATARLVMFTHQLGWELKVDGAGILLTQVCRSDREIENVSAGWMQAMIEKGWSAAASRAWNRDERPGTRP